jgi:O-glycosyl hydrolase
MTFNKNKNRGGITMASITVAPEDLKRRNREEAMRLSELWEDYADKLNSFTELIIEAGINPELLTDVVNATISLYRN